MASRRFRGSKPTSTQRARAAVAMRRATRNIRMRNALVFQDATQQSVFEKKNVDQTSTVMITAGQTTGNLLLLNGLAQGNSAVTRVGRTVKMKSLFVRFQASLASTSAGHSPLRFLVIYDKQTNAAAPAVTDITVADYLAAPMNLNNSKRFIVLMDKVLEEGLSTAGPGANGFEFYRKLDLNVEFNANSAGDVTDITSGSVYMVVWQNGNIITAAPTSRVYTRIRFTDA